MLAKAQEKYPAGPACASPASSTGQGEEKLVFIKGPWERGGATISAEKRREVGWPRTVQGKVAGDQVGGVLIHWAARTESWGNSPGKKGRNDCSSDRGKKTRTLRSARESYQLMGKGGGDCLLSWRRW